MNYLLLALALLTILYVIYLYNMLIARKNAVQNALSSIDVYLKQRFDLIPNLVATVKEYMTYERDLLSKITELRATLGRPELSQGEKFRLEGELSGLLGRLFAVAENYPQLRASENFLHLQKSLMEIEDRISAARRAYNSAVNEYNNALEMFPSNIMAGMMNLKRAEWFEMPEEQKEVPQISQLFGK